MQEHVTEFHRPYLYMSGFKCFRYANLMASLLCKNESLFESTKFLTKFWNFVPVTERQISVTKLVGADIIVTLLSVLFSEGAVQMTVACHGYAATICGNY